MGSPLRDGTGHSAGSQTQSSDRPSPSEANGLPTRPAPSPYTGPSLLSPPTVPEEAPPTRPIPVPPRPSLGEGSPGRSPTRKEERFAAPLPSPQESSRQSPVREEELHAVERGAVPRLPSPPVDSVVVWSPAREEKLSAPPGQVPRLASLLLQESPASSPAHEARRGESEVPAPPRKETPPLGGGPPPLPISRSEPTEHQSYPATSILNRASIEDPPSVTKFEHGGSEPETHSGSKVVSWILRRRRRGQALGRVVIGVRLSAMALSLVSFSVMAADKTQGWAGDSFDRYMEYRFCITMNILTFVYSGFQAYAGAHRLIYEKDIIPLPWRYFFDLTMDQVLAYLLMAASSAATARTDDWVSNWGSDPFTVMANGSTAVSYLAFVAVAVSALISAHALFGRRP